MPDHTHDSPGRKNPPVWKPRGDATSETFRKDPYEERHRPGSSTVCTECGVAFLDGIWKWPGEPPEGAERGLCPACRRARDDYPAGFITASGPFLRGHHDEIVNLIRNVEASEKAERPLHRILDLREADDELQITTTDVHLPRRIGEALRSAYSGHFDYHYVPNEHILRGRWTRDDEDE